MPSYRSKAVADMNLAVRYIRAHAAEFNIRREYAVEHLRTADCGQAHPFGVQILKAQAISADQRQARAHFRRPVV